MSTRSLIHSRDSSGDTSDTLSQVKISGHAFDPLSPKEHEIVRRIIETSSKMYIDLYLIENKVFRM